MELARINHFCVKCFHCGEQADFTTIVDNPSAYEAAQNIPDWINTGDRLYCSYDCWAMKVIENVLMPGNKIEIMREALKKAINTIWTSADKDVKAP